MDMTVNPERAAIRPPSWPHCGHGATSEAPVGCRGVRVLDYTSCLFHLDEADRTAYFASLAAGADVDHSGTSFTEELLRRLLDALRDPTTGQCRFGRAQFSQAVFSATVRFTEVTFSDTAYFDAVKFTGDAWFDGATFSATAWFDKANFTGDARFDKATFTGVVWFQETTFSANATFIQATFVDTTLFAGTVFSATAAFDQARFESASHLGPIICGGWVTLDSAVFGAPVSIDIAARTLTLRRTRWESTATLWVRYAEVQLTQAVLEYPVTLAPALAPFTDLRDNPLSEEVLAGRDPGVRVTILTGVDAAHLALMDVDLSGCLFAGTVHLDQLRLDGRITFARPPTGWHRRGVVPLRWSRRRTLAEEHHWRAATASQPAPGQPAATGGWEASRHHPGPRGIPGPETIAAVYRQLRKALEDSKNEPGAADFYYGECEMRRHDRTGTPFAERALLAAYWAVSGYGLRASRALTWLASAMTATVAIMMLWGLPTEAPKPTVTGRQVQAGHTLTLVTDTPAPVNPTGAWSKRVTTERFEKALRVVINSVIFRSSGQDLTTAGTYAEMTSRLTEPVLLGLAVLAVRSRVKR
ncbi:MULTISPECIES: pentapeptide repeat-containing protein [unclassified Streptomyces]|uniref:pentapeptide repeat-containing protein n=1 Tax=unclassified Streptomyces TaxID=2593676 RepID=UPI0033BE16FC